MGDKNLKELRRSLRRADYTDNIGSGGYREVFRADPEDIDLLMENDGGIIKVAWGDQGKTVNQQEMKTWQAVRGTSCERMFCPITSIHPDGNYIVMREAKDVKNINKNLMRIFEKEVKSSIDLDKSNVPEPTGCFDIKNGNVGRYKDNIVLIDYPYGADFSIEPGASLNIFERIIKSLV